jgi:hypothetical protein
VIEGVLGPMLTQMEGLRMVLFVFLKAFSCGIPSSQAMKGVQRELFVIDFGFLGSIWLSGHGQKRIYPSGAADSNPVKFA